VENGVTDDPFHLDRFVTAQNPVIDRVRAELRDGRKQSHWMWFIFPQLRGLGHSAMAQYYGIGSAAEARAYCSHPVLGPRLLECTRLVNAADGLTITEILGDIDALKFCSSMTLFAAVAEHTPEFAAALNKYFAGAADQTTLDRL
jgi:uncharacterized protein (DUF1810 family)